MIRRALVFCLAAVVALPSFAGAQQASTQKFPSDKFVNLQVFPKDTKPEVLIQAMKNFTRYLGMRCQYCHVGKEGMPLTNSISCRTRTRTRTRRA